MKAAGWSRVHFSIVAPAGVSASHFFSLFFFQEKTISASSILHLSPSLLHLQGTFMIFLGIRPQLPSISRIFFRPPPLRVGSLASHTHTYTHTHIESYTPTHQENTWLLTGTIPGTHNDPSVTIFSSSPWYTNRHNASAATVSRAVIIFSIGFSIFFLEKIFFFFSA